ncbi:hypothetical protein ACFFHF_16475 [Robertmurraya beringensis]|uniref:DUF4231 domain-containing protein n=1 Tax=Robertmurraya beringensis TaxID=641660 RepID=A0ABV6KTZ1_9BACI
MIYFSTKRLFLIFFIIGIAALLLYINTIVNPSYNNDTYSLFVSIVCLSIATYTLTGLLGINRRIKQLEDKIWQEEFREENKEEIESMARKIRFSEANKVKPSLEETELKKFYQSMKTAEANWKCKRKNEHNLFELYMAKEHTLNVYKKITDIWSIFVLGYTAFYILNLSITDIPFLVFYLMVLVVFIALAIIGLKKSRQLQELRQELYPKVVTDLIKMVED